MAVDCHAAPVADCRVARRRNIWSLVTAIFAIAQIAVMPACTVYDAYKTCGFSGCAGDSAITANVQTLFAEHPALEPPNLITVQTVNHVVYLYGLVDTDLQRTTAAEVAQQATGVVRIVNSIGLNNTR